MPEILVIGAGPAGCTVATTLARAGHDVLMVDRHDPPQTAIGESLIPVCGEIFAELGVDMEGFQTKHGAVFTHENRSVRFAFKDGMRPDHVLAWQTPRVELDSRMRQAALQHGVQFEVREVHDFDLPAGIAKTSSGDLHADFIIDAGGRTQLLARHLGIRTRHPWLKNSAIGAWHRGVIAQPEEEPGDVVICAFEGGWFWFIPFADGSWSVGATLTPEGPRGKDRWKEALARCPAAQTRLQQAERIEPFASTSDISVSSTAFYGDNWALVGDAATFLDPVFSSGVALGLHAGRDLARTWSSGGSLAPWEQRCRDAVQAFEPVVKSFYDGSFLRIAFADPKKQKQMVRQAIVSLLAGDVFDVDFSGPRRLGARLDSIERMVT